MIFRASNPQRVGRIRIMIVDRDPLMRVAVRLQLEKLRDLQVVASAGPTDQALVLMRSLEPDLIVGDMRSEGQRLDFGGEVSRLFPRTRVIRLSSEEAEHSSAAGSVSAADGMVLKEKLCQELPAEIQRVCSTLARD